jgi:hypothetical protein
MSNVSRHMASTHYDADSTPNAQEWLAILELERIRLVQNYHVAKRIKEPRMKAHAVMHAVVENQIASGYGPSRRAVSRLQAEGLSRHDAVHAIASVLADFVFELSSGQNAEQQASYQSRMGEAIEHLQAKQWLTSANDG